MFGLIKHSKQCHEDYISFKQNYCGTCKTIGRLYGLKERLLLNNDVVFLSELLAEINNSENDFKYLTVNTCYSIPKDEAHFPIFLKYTASVNILLGYYKFLDNIKDSKYKLNIWKVIKSIETTNFKKAKSYLKSIEFPIELIESLIQQQFLREAEIQQFTSFQDTFKYYSELTGRITGEVFKHGATLLENSDLSDLLYIIGQKYGEVVYLFDAIIDYEKDIKNNSFNLFQIANCDKRNDHYAKKEIIDYIHSNILAINESINLLPISKIKKNSFNNRLLEIASSIVSKQAKYANKQCKPYKSLSIKVRYNYALSMARNKSKIKDNLVIRNIYFMVFAFSFILIFLLFPNLIHAQTGVGINEHDFCGNCTSGCCQCCSNCCQEPNVPIDKDCCCTNLGDSFQKTFFNWPGCCYLPCACCCVCSFFGEAGGACCGGESVEGPKIIVIEKETCGC